MITLRNGVETAIPEGMAAANSFERQDATGHSAVMTYCLGGILRTRGGKAAAAAAAK